jgi:hypothetical protein
MIQAGPAWHRPREFEHALDPAGQLPPIGAHQICFQTDHAVDHDFRTTQMQAEGPTRKGDLRHPRPVERSDYSREAVWVHLNGVVDYWAERSVR